MKRLNDIRFELEQIANHESMKWFRIASKAQAKGCSPELVQAIRKEAFWLNQYGSSDPCQLLALDFPYKTKYIFR
jgi:hypothetical protein